MSYEPNAQHPIREWDEVFLSIAGKTLSARIYQPDGSGPFPAIVDVHGGDWAHLDRHSDFYPCRQLARSGIVVISIDYRQAPAFKYPAALQDTNFAVRWTKLNAGRLKINPDQVGGFGLGSGAEMITLTALRPLDTLFAATPLPGAEELDASLAFVLALDPVFDATARYEYIAKQPAIASWVDDTEYPRLLKSLPTASLGSHRAFRFPGFWGSLRGLPLPGYARFERWIESRLQMMPMQGNVNGLPPKRLLAGLVKATENFFTAYEEMADASPLSVLFAGGAQRYPPIFAAQGTEDTTLLMESTLSFISAYLRVGARIKFEPVNGVGHEFVRLPSHQADACISEMKNFLQDVLLRAAQNTDND